MLLNSSSIVSMTSWTISAAAAAGAAAAAQQRGGPAGQSEEGDG
jgi:hypothetical protein